MVQIDPSHVWESSNQRGGGQIGPTEQAIKNAIWQKMNKEALEEMQNKNTAKRNMSSAVCASSMYKSLAPTPIYM